MDSLQIAASLRRYGFEEVEQRTHALGYSHPAMGGQRVYLKVSRAERGERAMPVGKQPLVLHPATAAHPGFARTRVAAMGPNYRYKNSNMSAFPRKPGESATGIAVDVPDLAALEELLLLLGVPVAQAGEAATGLPAPDRPAARTDAPRQDGPAPIHPASGEAAVALQGAARGATYHAREAIDFAEHCCQGTGRLEAGPFNLDALAMAIEGPRRLRFCPLGNRPAAPRLALVGITPGSQIEAFADALSTTDVATAASHAAFSGAQQAIKKLLQAHGFAARLGISLEGDLNQNPAILTTSVVKCCLMVDDGYRFAAPDIAASPAALKCATERLVRELRGYATLEWIVVFGGPAWEALHALSFEGRPVIEALREGGRHVVQLPHFAQNFQQRELYACDDRAEAELIAAKPDRARYADEARRMRHALLVELAKA
ncbi:hypothetical protein [Pseudoxanthomonas sp. SGT-18]|uniref:hypothetical protein n=1 Tax=Pseudoxanthomonas sp. SGT-18 TaxID=2493087 RepID=UPI000F629EFB|nr:hypothetical protein [Pseudoxanthomonas sp. SGT-18]